MSESTAAEFGKIRSFLWPVHSYELKKIIPMLIMAFCISFNYTILRDTKDVLVVTASSSEAIPFLKLWGVVPCAILFMLAYAKLSNILSREKLFYATILPFIVFFTVFGYFLYPMRESLHPHAAADYLQSVLPAGLAGLVGCFRNWTFSTFYIMAELWGSAVLSLLFWGFANEIVRTFEAKRFYTLFTLAFNVALMVSGPLIIYYSQLGKMAPAGTDPWQVSLNWLITWFLLASLTIIACYWWMQRNVLNDKRFYDPESGGKKKKDKPKLTIRESLAFLSKSRYLRYVALLVVGYGMSINLVEVVWKGQVKEQFPNYNDYSQFMGFFSTFTGIITVCMTFVGGYIIRSRSWGFAASLTPLALLITGTAFFVFVVFKDYLSAPFAVLGLSPVLMAVIIGLIQNIASKSTKYSLFDPTKEMAYIPLDQESKVKGKAAIDVVGARLGKSGGSALYNILLPLLGGLAAATPIVAVVMIGVIFAWLRSVRGLESQYVALTGESSESSETSTAAANA